MILLNNIKRILIGFIIALASFNASVFAYEIEEETDYVWLQEEIENVSTNASKDPNILSTGLRLFRLRCPLHRGANT